MRTFLMIMSAGLMVLSAYFAISDFMRGQYFWAIVMAFCWILNYRTFTKCVRSE